MSGRISSEVVSEAIRQVLAGDVDRYETIYRLTDGPLRAFVRSRFGHYGDDFVQETAIVTHETALARFGEYDPARGAYSTWLCWLSRTVAHKLIRERFGPRYSPFDANWLEEQVAPGPGPAERMEHDRRRRVLREELQHLPEDQRRVIELYDLEGRTLTESARELGIPVYTACRRRQRALKDLESRLVERDVHIVERDWTPMPRFSGWERGAHDDDDWCATVGANLPDQPDPLVDATAKDEREEDEPGP